MSLNNPPSKKEVMGWNPQSLSDYLRRLNLTGCDKVVIKGSITGAQFMKMTPRELQVFPSLYVSLITKIQREINKEEQKWAFGPTLKAQSYTKQVFIKDKNPWESDEFDNESDHDYETPDQEEREDGDICSMTESQTAEDSDKICKENPVPVKRILKPQLPHLPRMNHTHQRPLKISVSQPNPYIDRSKKPGQPGPSMKDLSRLKEGSAIKALGSFTSKIPQPRTPKPRDVPNRASNVIPPPTLTEPAMVNISIPGQSLYPSWYGGKVTRHQAEVALRGMNKDGVFMVRDSSKGSAEHPYTLMLLKQGKIYNIKIRNQGNSYFLGTSINNKSFPGVKELITHHTNIPLLLTDATDQSSERQNMCCLLYPAGL